MKNQRSFNIRENGVINEDNSFSISFSSEKPYLRIINKQPMMEVLSHDPKHMDLSRATQGLSLLWNHDKALQVGRAESITLDPVEKKGLATIRFGASEKARELASDVSTGIVSDVSFGYEVRNYEIIAPKNGEKYPTALVTDWMPYEISLVSVPADETVGVGRAMEDTCPTCGSTTDTTSPEVDTEDTLTETSTPEIEVDITVNVIVNNEDSESNKSDELITEQDTTCIKSHSSIEEITMDNKELEITPVTMPKAQEKNFEVKDMKNYSVGRAINGILNGSLTGYEREISQELSMRGLQPTIIPTEAFTRSTEMAWADTGNGADMKVTGFGSYLELLLTGSALNKLGVPVMNLQAPTVFPALDSIATPTALAEQGAAVSPEAPFTRQVTFSPNILVSGFGVSRTALSYSPASLDSYLKQAIMKKHIQEFDKKAIAKLLTEITVTVAGNGTGTISDDIGKVMELATRVMDVTDLNDTCAYLTRNNILNALKLVVKASGLTVPVATKDTILDWKAVSSANLAQVSLKDPIIFGDWSYAAFANFGAGVNIVTDIYGANAYTDSVSLIAQAHYDAHILNVNAFAKMVTEVA